MLGPSSVVYRLPSGPALAGGHLPTVLSIASAVGAQILCGGLSATCGAARALGHASACQTPPPPTRVSSNTSRSPAPQYLCVCSSVFHPIDLSAAEPCCNPPLDLRGRSGRGDEQRAKKRHWVSRVRAHKTRSASSGRESNSTRQEHPALQRKPILASLAARRQSLRTLASAPRGRDAGRDQVTHEGGKQKGLGGGGFISKRDDGG